MAKAKVVIETAGGKYVSGVYSWLQMLLIGAGIGLIVAVSTWLIGSFVVDPILCGRSATEMCLQAGSVTGNIAAVIGMLVGLGVLIRLRTPRGLLIVIPILASLWGLATLYQGLEWWLIALWLVALYALAYVTYGWLSRLRIVWAAVVAAAIAVIVVRLVIFL